MKKLSAHTDTTSLISHFLIENRYSSRSSLYLIAGSVGYKHWKVVLLRHLLEFFSFELVVGFVENGGALFKEEKVSRKIRFMPGRSFARVGEDVVDVGKVGELLEAVLLNGREGGEYIDMIVEGVRRFVNEGDVKEKRASESTSDMREDILKKFGAGISVALKKCTLAVLSDEKDSVPVDFFRNIAKGILIRYYAFSDAVCDGVGFLRMFEEGSKEKRAGQGCGQGPACKALSYVVSKPDVFSVAWILSEIDGWKGILEVERREEKATFGELKTFYEVYGSEKSCRSLINQSARVNGSVIPAKYLSSLRQFRSSLLLLVSSSLKRRDSTDGQGDCVPFARELLLDLVKALESKSGGVSLKMFKHFLEAIDACLGDDSKGSKVRADVIDLMRSHQLNGDLAKVAVRVGMRGVGKWGEGESRLGKDCLSRVQEWWNAGGGVWVEKRLGVQNNTQVIMVHADVWENLLTGCLLSATMRFSDDPFMYDFLLLLLDYVNDKDGVVTAELLGQDEKCKVCNLVDKLVAFNKDVLKKNADAALQNKAEAFLSKGGKVVDRFRRWGWVEKGRVVKGEYSGLMKKLNSTLLRVDGLVALMVKAEKKLENGKFSDTVGARVTSWLTDATAFNEEDVKRRKRKEAEIVGPGGKAKKRKNDDEEADVALVNKPGKVAKKGLVRSRNKALDKWLGEEGVEVGQDGFEDLDDFLC